ncbi:MAG: hypothetical protein Hens2KO_06160 [Henriciella sp.]
MGTFGSRITAAAVTGPAQGPRPASSTPQIKSMFVMNANNNDSKKVRYDGTLRD